MFQRTREFQRGQVHVFTSQSLRVPPSFSLSILELTVQSSVNPVIHDEDHSGVPCWTQVTAFQSASLNKHVVPVPQIQDRIVESPRAKLQRVSSEDCRTQFLVQAVNQIAEIQCSSHAPNDIVIKSPCHVSSIFSRLQNNSSWTDSEAECRVPVFLACSQRRCEEVPVSSFRECLQ